MVPNILQPHLEDQRRKGGKEGGEKKRREEVGDFIVSVRGSGVEEGEGERGGRGC